MVESQHHLDTRALERAEAALSKADAVERGLIRHEDNCHEMAKQTSAKIDRLSDKMDDGFDVIHKKLDAVRDRSTSWWRDALTWLIIFLVALLGYILANGVPFLRHP